MDRFLNFKDKSYSAKYQGDLEFYTARQLYIQTILTLIVGSFTPYYQYKRYHAEGNYAVIRKSLTIIFFYCGFLLIAIIVRKYRTKLIKHQNKLILFFDLLYLASSVFYMFIIWENNVREANSAIRYLNGWLACLIIIHMFANITRWYIKLAAYFVIILRTGIGTYLLTCSNLPILLTAQLVMLLSLMAYCTEKVQREQFIEKQLLFDESQSFRDILQQTTDGIIIIGIEEGLLFQNWTSERHRWWDSRLTFDENMMKIQVSRKVGILRQPNERANMVSCIFLLYLNLL